MKDKFKNFEKAARIIEREKPVLHFFGLAHDRDAIDRWTLIVCSDQLVPWSFEALKYVGDILRKNLRIDEIVTIARIVVPPLDHEVLQSLINNDQIRVGKLSVLLDERYDRAVIFRTEPQMQKAN